MLNAVIIEDEIPAQDILINALGEASTQVKVQAVLNSVEEGISYFSGNVTPDIIFSDIQLNDGLSFEIFSHASITTPVIFVTAYDKFIVNAFNYNGIDYLLKPVDRNDLNKSLLKYKMLQDHFGIDPHSLQNLTNYLTGKKKQQRLIVKKGIENISMKLEDVPLFYTENKIVYVFDKSGKKYLIDKNLGELEYELDESTFFRVNRQYIINLAFVKGYKSYEKVKLQVELTIPEIDHFIIISQETAPAFRKWIADK